MIEKQKYIQRTGNTLMVRVTGSKQKNFHISKLDEAIKYRNAMCEKMGLPFSGQYNHKSPRLHIKPHKDKENNLPVGLTYAITKNQLADGTIAVYTAVRAGVTIAGKSKYKHFSVDRFGHKQAIKMAIEWRRKELLHKQKLMSTYQKQRILSSHQSNHSS